MRAALLCVGLAAAWPALPARADEAKTPINASMFLNIIAPRAEDRDTAYDRSLKDPGPTRRSVEGELLPDGSVRYGNVTMTVKNPCPPGTDHYDPVPLPGRRARK